MNLTEKEKMEKEFTQANKDAVKVTEKEFNLSEKRDLLESIYKKKNPSRKALIEMIFNLIRSQDKEFIKRLKEELKKEFIWKPDFDDKMKIIDKLAGPKLTKS